MFAWLFVCSEPPARTALNAVEYEEYGEYNRGEEIYQDLCSLQQVSHSEVNLCLLFF